jgi:hypothetical protein
MSNEVDPIEAELAELDAEEGKPPSSTVRRFLPATLAIVTLASFAAVVWYAYSTGVREGSEFAAPTLRPDGPSKVAPKSPGGQQIADQDKLVYGKIDKSGDGRKIERLLPPPENPLPAPLASKPAPTPKPPLPTPKLDVPKSPPTSALPPPPSITAPRKLSPQSEPAKKLEKQTKGAAALAAIVPSAGSKAIEKKTTPEPQALPPATPKKPPETATDATATSKPQIKKETSANLPKQVAKLDPAKGFRIQIGSLRSREAAKQAWDKRVKQHGSILAKLTLLVKRADLGKKGVYYRVQAGPMRSKEAAQRLCDALKQKKVGCFVVRP